LSNSRGKKPQLKLELAARIAALEHLLLEKGLCTRDELKQARAFIDTRRDPR
jgi:hypothetical protein